MKVWIDDIRDAPDGWTEIRKVQPAISFLQKYGGQIEEISIDHDIENRPDDETFQPVAHYLGLLYGFVDEQPKITIHSDNPTGAKEMVQILEDYGLHSEWHPFTSNEEFKTKYGLT